MKQTLLAAFLAAVAASALTFLLAEARSAAPPPAAGAVPAGLAELVAEIAALRREMAAGRTPGAAPDRPAAVLPPPPAAPVATGTPAAEPAPGPGAAPVDVAIDHAGEVPAEEVVPAVHEERSAIARAPEVVERLRGITQWQESADVRRIWILASEDAVVSTFGKPDEIYPQENGSETWSYRTQTGTRDEDGDIEWQDITLVMNRGRLVQVYD